MWCARLSDSQRDAIRALIKEQDELGHVLSGALEALELARWDELPDAQLPWDSVIEEARRQGVSEAEVVWDICGRHREPPAPRRSKAPRGAAA